MLNHENYKQLFEKRLKGQCSLQELDELEKYEESFKMIDTKWDEQQWGSQDVVQHTIHEKLEKEIDHLQSKNKKWYLRPVYAIAAAAAIVLVCMIPFWKHNGAPPSQPDIAHQTQTASIVPGGNNATLTLDDGSILDLKSFGVKEVSKNGNILAKNKKEGELEYLSGHLDAAPVYHTLRTPRGGQYRLTLADGTQVWLNSESSIRFPTHFTAAERTVEITGEVYFDVRKQAGKRFVVKTSNNQKITVLGTRFNVTAYPDENTISTSLIEGRVVLEGAGGQHNMKPGQKMVYNSENSSITSTTFDEYEVLAWQKGYFVFNVEPIESIMRKIARWYDVEVVYQGDMTHQAFSGKISRSKNVEDVLKKLSLTGTINFRIEGRRIYVMT